MMSTTKLSPSACLSCGILLDAASNVSSEGQPEAGDCTICIACGHIMVFDERLLLRDPNDEEAYQIAGDHRILAVQRARKALKKS
jgi:hypothetical protein